MFSNTLCFKNEELSSNLSQVCHIDRKAYLILYTIYTSKTGRKLSTFLKLLKNTLKSYHYPDYYEHSLHVCKQIELVNK